MNLENAKTIAVDNGFGVTKSSINDLKFKSTIKKGEDIYNANVMQVKFNDENYIDVTLKQFQGDPEVVKIDKSANIIVGRNYEFTFLTYTKFDDTIKNIFDNSTLLKIEETNKTGLDQINEGININEY